MSQASPIPSWVAVSLIFVCVEIAIVDAVAMTVVVAVRTRPGRRSRCGQRAHWSTLGRVDEVRFEVPVAVEGAEVLPHTLRPRRAHRRRAGGRGPRTGCCRAPRSIRRCSGSGPIDQTWSRSGMAGVRSSTRRRSGSRGSTRRRQLDRRGRHTPRGGTAQSTRACHRGGCDARRSRRPRA